MGPKGPFGLEHLLWATLQKVCKASQQMYTNTLHPQTTVMDVSKMVVLSVGAAHLCMPTMTHGLRRDAQRLSMCACLKRQTWSYRYLRAGQAHCYKMATNADSVNMNAGHT